MATNGLNATSYRGWISQDIRIDDFTSKVFSEFVLGTPAYGLSKKARGLYDFYEYQNASDYERLRKDLMNGISFYLAGTYESLKNKLLADASIGFENQIPAVLEEKIYMHIGEARDNKFLKKYFGDILGTEGKKNQEIQAEKLEKENILTVEKLFSHLRNGFAHGCFAMVDRSGENYYIIQDEKNNQISARMILKQSTLQAWINYLQVRRTLVLQKKMNEAM